MNTHYFITQKYRISTLSAISVFKFEFLFQFRNENVMCPIELYHLTPSYIQLTEADSTKKMKLVLKQLFMYCSLLITFEQDFGIEQLYI